MQNRSEINVTLLIQYLVILGLPLNASENDIKKAYRRRALETHPDKVQGREEEFKKINVAYTALTGVSFAEIVRLQKQILNEIDEQAEMKTVGDFLKKIFQDQLDSGISGFDIDAQLGLDDAVTFYLHVPIMPGLSSTSPILFDPVDYVTIMQEACKSRYWRISSSQDRALQNEMANGMSMVGYPFSCLQGGIHIVNRENMLAVPNVIPRFILYKIENITPRNLISSLMNGACLHILPFITHYATNRLDALTEELKQDILRLDGQYQEAAAVKSHAQYVYNQACLDGNANVADLRKQRDAAQADLKNVRNDINKFLRQIGKSVAAEAVDNLFSAKLELMEHVFPEHARRKGVRQLLASESYWFTANVRKSQAADRQLLLNFAPSCDGNDAMSDKNRTEFRDRGAESSLIPDAHFNL